jgi:hypothetical protein
MSIEKHTDSKLLPSTGPVKSRDGFKIWFKLATVAGAVIAFIVGVAQYVYSSHNEFKKRFWEERISLYRLASSAASSISVAESKDIFDKARLDFWNLYLGELSIVEDKEVRDAMVAYGQELSGTDFSQRNNLTHLSYVLARACRHSLIATWEPVKLDDIEDRPTIKNNR